VPTSSTVSAAPPGADAARRPLLRAVNDRVCAAGRLFVGALVLAVTLLILVNVVLRFVFSYTIEWTEEITKYSLMWIVFIGGGIAAREAGHLSIEMILSLLSPRAGRHLTLLVNAISAAVCIALGVIGWNAAASAWEFGQRGSASGLPIFWVYLSIPLGCAMLALGFVERAWKATQGEVERLSADSFGN
jgi:C4-dicarboxylate transporter, DctQ subunit